MSRWTQDLFMLNAVPKIKVQDGDCDKDTIDKTADGHRQMGRNIKRHTLWVTNTIGQLAWQLSQYTKSLTTVMLWVDVFLWEGFHTFGWFYFNMFIIATEGIKATGRRIKRWPCRCLQGELREEIISHYHLYLSL